MISFIHFERFCNQFNFTFCNMFSFKKIIYCHNIACIGLFKKNKTLTPCDGVTVNVTEILYCISVTLTVTSQIFKIIWTASFTTVFHIQHIFIYALLMFLLKTLTYKLSVSHFPWNKMLSSSQKTTNLMTLIIFFWNRGFLEVNTCSHRFCHPQHLSPSTPFSDAHVAPERTAPKLWTADT